MTYKNKTLTRLFVLSAIAYFLIMFTFGINVGQAKLIKLQGGSK